MLDGHDIEYRYREYTREPLDESELRALLEALGATARDLLRTRDRAFRELGLTGEESESALISAMAQHPTLLQRPIGVVGKLGRDAKAAVGRPPEQLLSLLPPSSD